MTTWPEEYDPYVGLGFNKENGEWVKAYGIHITADAPDMVKEYFRQKIEFYKTHDFDHPPITIH